MRSSVGTTEDAGLLEVTSRSDFADGVTNVIRRIAGASDEAEAVELLGLAAQRLGADGACFVSFIRDDDMQSSFRYLVACDPSWMTEYVQQRWFMDDPWLAYAINATEPVLASQLQARGPPQQAMLSTAAEAGFRSAIIAPSPSAAGESRVGVLYLGSNNIGHFEGEGYAIVRLFARLLAVELHEWWMHRIRDELMVQARITDSDLALLRHELAGHGSKAIAAALGTEAKTIDCRFQRLNMKLGAANRRAAVRLARLYGLI